MPFGLLVCHVCCIGYGLASRQLPHYSKPLHSFSFIYPLHPLRYLHWVSFRFIHFSRFSQCQLPIIRLACVSLGLRSIGAYFFLLPLNLPCKNKPTNCPCVVLCGINQCKDFLHLPHATGVAPALGSLGLTPLEASCSRAAHPRSARRRLAIRTSDCKPFHFAPLHFIFCNRSQPLAAGAFTLLNFYLMLGFDSVILIITNCFPSYISCSTLLIQKVS